MVFQRFNLFPHMTALENISEAPIKVKRIAKAQARAEAMALLEKVGLSERASTTPPSCPAASSSGWPSRGPWR